MEWVNGRVILDRLLTSKNGRDPWDKMRQNNQVKRVVFVAKVQETVILVHLHQLKIIKLEELP